LVTGQTLAILYDRIFLLSQSFMPVVDDLLLGFLLYRSRLVPRVLPVVAFIGAPLLLVSWFGVLFGLWPQRSTLTTLAAVPVALFEFSRGRLSDRQGLQTFTHYRRNRHGRRCVR
jgi:hypothetical protein